MLEANKGLGYRDIQEILAYSSSRATFLDREVDRAFNGSKDWNGGALLASHDFGYGHIDAHAAVRMAESWMKTSVVGNLATGAVAGLRCDQTMAGNFRQPIVYAANNFNSPAQCVATLVAARP